MRGRLEVVKRGSYLLLSSTIALSCEVATFVVHAEVEARGDMMQAEREATTVGRMVSASGP